MYAIRSYYATGGYGEYLHGEAISIGMAAAALIAVHRGREAAIYERTVELLQGFGLPTAMPVHLDEDQLISAMMHDKKFTENKIVFVLPVITSYSIHYTKLYDCAL